MYTVRLFGMSYWISHVQQITSDKNGKKNANLLTKANSRIISDISAEMLKAREAWNDIF
jgi:hypothetical protein